MAAGCRVLPGRWPAQWQCRVVAGVRWAGLPGAGSGISLGYRDRRAGFPAAVFDCLKAGRVQIIEEASQW